MKERAVLKGSPLFDSEFYLQNYPEIKNSPLDPVGHYLKIGYLEGKNPSIDFNNDLYFMYNPDVKRLKVNPLIHYLCFGKNEGRKIYKVNDIEESINSELDDVEAFSPKKIVNKPVNNKPANILITCFLAVDDPILDLIADVSNRLIADGVKVSLSGCTPLFEKKGLPNLIRRPFLLSKYSTDNVDHSLSRLPWVEELVLNELTWNDKSKLSDSELSNLLAAVTLWNNFFLKNRPSFVFVWGTTAPLSKLLIKLCNDYSVSYFVIERGHFPNTLWVDHVGHGISSSVSFDFNKKSEQSPKLKEIVKWFNSNKHSVPYTKFNLGDTFQSASNKKKIFYMGSNDKGSGTETKDIFAFKGVFTSTFEAVSYLKRLEESGLFDVEFLFKPHPADKNDYSKFESKNFKVLDNVNVNKLIELSDVCVSTSTTAFASCIMMNKPVVSLGLSELTGKGILYDCSHESEISTQIRFALDKYKFEEKSLKGKSLIVDLFEKRLVSDDSVPTVNKSEDLYNLVREKILLANGKLLGEKKENLSPASLKRTVIVPVYGDAQATKECLDSLIASELDDILVIVINDCSPYYEIESLLKEYEAISNFRVIHNSKNLGFTGTVNKGIELSGKSDVVILNSDTVVAGDWLTKLTAVAYSRNDVATVTPLSNNASIFTLEMKQKDMSEQTVREINNTLSARYASDAIEVPVGHGFCLYIKRCALDRVGLFDELTFGKGYSEEVDFCLRASNIGYKHLCAKDTFVAHVGGVSFSDGAELQRAKNRKIIQERYPGYFKKVADFAKTNPIHSIKIDGI